MIDDVRRRLRAAPDPIAQHARDFYAGGPAAAATPRRAATVLVLRDLPYTVRAPGGIEVYMLKRRRSMAFAGGMYAFPGGGVEPEDIDVQSAAVREAAEETGLRLTELYAWSRWVTPEFEPRRYDTWFYVARQPDGAQPRDVSGEADWAGWVTPQAALRDYAESMLPPTAISLAELSNYRTVDSTLVAAEHRDLTPIEPRIVFDGDSAHFALPGDSDYPQ